MQMSLEEIKDQWEKKTKPVVDNCYRKVRHDPNLTNMLEKVLNCVDSDILNAEQNGGFTLNKFEEIPDLCLVLKPIPEVILSVNYAEHCKNCTPEQRVIITETGNELTIFYKLVQYGPIRKDKQEDIRPRVDNNQAIDEKDVYGINKDKARKNFNLNI